MNGLWEHVPIPGTRGALGARASPHCRRKLGSLSGGSDVLRCHRCGLHAGGCGSATLLGPIVFLQPPPILEEGHFTALVDSRKAGAELSSPVPELTGYGRSNRSVFCKFLILLVIWSKSRKESEVCAMFGSEQGLGDHGHREMSERVSDSSVCKVLAAVAIPRATL